MIEYVGFRNGNREKEGKGEGGRAEYLPEDEEDLI